MGGVLFRDRRGVYLGEGLILSQGRGLFESGSCFVIEERLV